VSGTKAIDRRSLLVEPGKRIHLMAFDPASTLHFKAKDDAAAKQAADIERLATLQDMLYAQSAHAVLIILQGMDAAGKDGAITHVMSGVNPQGVDVFAFKQPSARELLHDYLWRCEKVLPELGRIAIFNRSYYEEVVVVRVHAPLLEAEPVSQAGSPSQIWQERFEDINAFERHLSRNGTLVLKFFLHLSKDEQRKRLLKRIDTPAKNWKFSESDVRERAFWDKYQLAYEDLITHTSTAWAPWYVIPADHKWCTRAAIADIIVAKLEELKLSYPPVSDELRVQIQAARKALI
jgi:PPK2 family polyphosphate:nucleotide phosphotransferase